MEETNNESIEKKLAYLNETKGLIKSAIINKGQELTNETPFRDYVQKINNIETGVDIGTCVYTQNETPTDFNGIWINTDKNCNDIYIEDSYCPTVEQPIFQGFDEGDSNVVYNTVPPYDIIGATTCQVGNVIHFFGREVDNPTGAPEATHSNHYKYDFETDTWTKLADCPTPQGEGGAVNIGNYIYVIGSGFKDYCKNVYKYNIKTDSWEKVGDMHGNDFNLTEDTINRYGCWVCKDDNDNVYVRFNRDTLKPLYGNTRTMILFKLNLENAELVTLFSVSAAANDVSFYRETLSYCNGFILFPHYYYDNGKKYAVYIYDVSTNSKIEKNNLSADIELPVIEFNGYAYNTYNNKLRILQVTQSSVDLIQQFTISNTHNIDQNYLMKNENIRTPKQFIVTKDNVDYLLMFGPASYTTTRTMAIRLTDKTYDLDNDTVMIYTDKNARGLYKTQMFNSTKIIGTGKLYSYFSNVNLYDATQQQIIKNLTTYYGNGTEWIKIK